MIAFVLSLFWASALSASSIASTGLDEYDEYNDDTNDENADYEDDQPTSQGWWDICFSPQRVSHRRPPVQLHCSSSPRQPFMITMKIGQPLAIVFIDDSEIS